MCDLLDIFANVNAEIVKHDDEKRKLGKRRKVTQIFKESTNCLLTIERLFKEIRLKPVNGIE
jgi:hypothetical protein